MITIIFYFKEFKISAFLKRKYGFWAVQVAISQNFLRNENYGIKFKKPLCKSNAMYIFCKSHKNDIGPYVQVDLSNNNEQKKVLL